MVIRSLKWFGLAALAALIFTPAWLNAGERRGPTIKKGPYNPDDQTVEMFAAMEAGDVDVKIIPKDEKEARIFIENKTDKPLNVKLPNAFVGVLAQFGGGAAGGGFGAGGAGGGGGGSNQAMGGGMGMMGGGMMGGGMMGGGMGGGGFFNVPPKRVGEFKVPGVCLEHGKPEPRAAIAYVIRPVETFSKDPLLKELLALFGTGKVNQRVAQVAAWHISDKMSWQELAAKRVTHLNGLSFPYFSPQEIVAAQRLVSFAEQRVKAQKNKPVSPGEQLGLNP